jgi:signal transduction histidine kinase
MASDSVRRLDPTPLAATAIAVAIGVVALAIARGPGRFTTYAGRSGLAAALTAIAGLSLILAGLITWRTRSAFRIGVLAVCAGVLWFAPIYAGWDGGPTLVRSLGMLASPMLVPSLLHLILSYPTGRLRSRTQRVVIVAVYGGAAILTLGLALFRDPFFDQYCWSNCTVNTFLLGSFPRLARGLTNLNLRFAAAAAVVVVTLCAVRLATGTVSERRALLPIVVPAVVIAAAAVGRAVVLVRLPLEDPSDPAFVWVFLIACFGVLLLGAALVWAVVRARLERRAVARTVASLGEAPLPGSLESALAAAVGDPDLRIAYWLPGPGRYVSADGTLLDEPVAQPGRSVTALVRDDRRVAMVSHAAGISELGREIGAAVRLGLENERLQAEVLAHLVELRASRARIVEAGDAERRRLERDLHDGAQQRLLALSYDIRLALAAAEADRDGRAASSLEGALDRTQGALAELRELAHGIYPAILAEAGLAPAIASLADSAPIPVKLDTSLEGRSPASVEGAAYLLVAEGIEDAARRGASIANVGIAREDGSMIVTIKDDGSQRRSDMIGVVDRVGAVGGRLLLEGTTLRAEIPCE